MEDVSGSGLDSENKHTRKEKSKRKSQSKDLKDGSVGEHGHETAEQSSQGVDEADTMKLDRKKEKKAKKWEKENGLTANVNGDIGKSKGNESSRKKKSKRKRELDEAEGESAVTEKASRKAEKKKKLEHSGDVEMADDEPESLRKSNDAAETENGDLSTPVESFKKKKKRRTEEATFAATGSSTPQIPVTSSTKSSTTHPLSSNSVSSPSASEIEKYLSTNSISISAPSSSYSVIPVLSFTQLESQIPVGLRDALKGFKEPTPIQACSWPAALAGRDVVGIAETGSGKTLAFGLPALAGLISSDSSPDTAAADFSSKKSKSKSKSSSTSDSPISILVLAPTRELAIQTHDTLCALGEPFGMTSVAVYGGVDKEPQKRALKKGRNDKGLKTRMVVGTPGRILDLVNEGACDLSHVTYLVLDEADRMLDKGFENDIRTIISHTTPIAGRQTLMFSATWPDAVRRLASTFQKEPIRITVGSDDLTANKKVEQSVEVFEDSREKDSRLTALLRALQHKKTSHAGSDEARILIFVLYKKEAARVENTLRRQGYDVSGIHGDLSQAARIAALDNFKTGATGLLVATDVAARGLDIPNVGAVINYSFPLTIEDYIHRIGRTGRGGRSGKSITFFTGDNHERALAGELARVLRESGFNADALQEKFPMTIKKKTHSVYGAFFRDDIPVDAKPTRIKF